MPNKVEIPDIKQYFINLQNSIILELENFTESKFLRDKWERSKGGGGITSIFEDGKIAKSKIAQIIFNSKAEREWLESIIHPIVRKEWTDIVSKSDKKTQVVEIPLLYEKEMQADFQWVIAVYASIEVRQVRLEQRGLTKEEACLRIKNQLPLEEKVRHADFVFLANSSESFLKRQVHNFVKNFF